jgi:hypothetical protein
MFRRVIRRIVFALGLWLLVAAQGCATDRPSRNGVFNENQYVRKDFLIGALDGTGDLIQPDPGWLLRTTVTETSTPNLLGGSIGIWGGLEGEVDYVHFRVTEDKLQLLSLLQLTDPNAAGQLSQGVTDYIENSWPVTNVDLKYRIDLDGQRTNFYEENQELPWQQRQWVKLNFAKNDLSDVAPLGAFTVDLLNRCSDAGNTSATLVANSFRLEGQTTPTLTDDYMEFTVQVTIPMTVDDPTCLEAYRTDMADSDSTNPLAVSPMYRSNVTVNLKYSFKRATPTSELTYTPFILAEKDPIHHKYGPFLYTTFNRDPSSGQLAAEQFVGRFDPTKPIVWYFDKNFPTVYKSLFVNTAKTIAADDPTTIRGATNALLVKSGAAARVDFKEYTDGLVPNGMITEGDCEGSGYWWNVDINVYGGNGVCYADPPREYGDIRYNFLRWESDEDVESEFSAVTMPGFDPRTGEIINEGIEFNDLEVQNLYTQRIDAFLQSIGAVPTVTPKGGTAAPLSVNSPGEWPTGACTTGETRQIVPATLVANHNAQSTLFSKMQQYLNLNSTDPDPNNDHLGPENFEAKCTNPSGALVPCSLDPDFQNAYFALIPYQLFADPAMNLFVTPEAGQGVTPPSVWQALQNEVQFHAIAATINDGTAPFTASGPSAVTNGATFGNSLHQLTLSHLDYQRMRDVLPGNNVRRDSPDAFSLEEVIVKDAQHCIDGHWETKEHWQQGLIMTYWQQNAWHEFGHAMGLEHNFMASVDLPNFPTPVVDSSGIPHYPLYSSSVMEYNMAPDRLFWTPAWGSYDQGAIVWIYANNGRQSDPSKDAAAASKGALSGQLDATYPYADPLGFDATGKVEHQFLRCDETHLKYSPLCRQKDLGVTPSEIIANEIDYYDWQYQWRNFRSYRKVWDNSAYADGIAETMQDLRRFLSMWTFDWSPGEVGTILRRIGITVPPGAISAQDYYQQLTQKFTTEMSVSNRTAAAFHEAVIQQASGDRPYKTVYDPFYGDETQQGIILDKLFAMQNFVDLWASTDNYDPNQTGVYISSWQDFGEASYNSVAQSAVTSMVGGQYAVYNYFIPLAVDIFAQATNNPLSYPNNDNVAKDWIGGHVFTRIQDLVDYFKAIAVSAGTCASFEACTYDVTDPTVNNAGANSTSNPGVVPYTFVAPDELTYSYAYIASRNEWVEARKDVNVITFKAIQQFNTDLFVSFDDGTNGTDSLQYPIEYLLDAYTQYAY